ncbi:schlafen family member 5-like [Acropora millepora]|uniref:schlafen family member 5-like n=1 Tax=Acropora millepora TaxID=45264 RepID=UPI001CF4E54C|nr:schlafen family member 5-like [Acropora millepora]
MEPKEEMEAPPLKRGHEGTSDFETAPKVTRIVDVEHGQEFKVYGAGLQESGYGSSLETSIVESMDSEHPSEESNPFESSHELCRLFAENVLQCEVSLSQQVAGQQKRERKKRRKEKSDDILGEKSIQDEIIEKTCALLNSGGGVMRMTISDHQALQSDIFLHRLDMFWKTIEQKLTSLVLPATYDDVFDRRNDSKEILLFVNAPKHLCTIHYNLCIAGEAEVREASFDQVVGFLEKSGHCNQKSNVQTVDVSINNLPNVQQEFSIGKKCGFHESKQVQLKNYSGQILLSRCQRDQMRKTISAFANTKGGKIFLGIDDSCVVHGVNMKENNRGEIKDRVKSIITDRMIFPVNPQEKIHWDIEFIPVSGCDTTQDLDVVIIKIAGIKSFGGVFMKGPKSYELCHGKVEAVEFHEWKNRLVSASKLQTSAKVMEHLCSKFEKLHLSQGVFPVLSIRDQVQKIRDLFFVAQDGFPVTPEGFQESLEKEVQDIIVRIQKLSSTSRKRGLIVASKSWQANLGESPSNDVICDLLVISRGLGGLHLYTVCKEGKEEDCLSYSREVSLLIKKHLVQNGGCSVKFYITNHVVSSSAKVEPPHHDKRYPRCYDLCNCKQNLNVVLKALVIILAQVPSPLSTNLGVKIMCLLTKEQFQLVHNEIHHRRELWVKGAAGTGKTLVAREVIKKIVLLNSLDKNEILFVAENEGIVQQIRNAHVCNAVCRQTFMQHQFPEARHVIMDEAHDYEQPDPEQSWYEKAKGIVEQPDPDKSGYLWFFTDEEQRDHNFRTGMPPEDMQQPEFRLKCVIRNSGTIFKYTLKHLGQQGGIINDDLFLGHDFEGENVATRYYTSSKQSQSDVLTKTVRGLLDEGYRPRDLAVLFSKGDLIPNNLSFGSDCRIGTAKENSSCELVVSAVKKYSGLDRPVVVLVDLECTLPYGRILHSFQYSAQTRAMVKLVIIRCESCRKILCLNRV